MGRSGKRFPWEDRRRLGVFAALVETVKLLATNPSEAFGRLRRERDYASPILFGLILTLVSVFLSQIWNAFFGGISSVLRGEIGSFAFTESFGVIGLLISAVLTVVIYIPMLFFASAVTHVCLLLVNALERSPTGFEGTFKVGAYASVSGLASAIPFAGVLAQFVIALVLAIIGLAAAHRTSIAKAVFGALLPFALCAGGLVVLLVVSGVSLLALLASG